MDDLWKTFAATGRWEDYVRYAKARRRAKEREDAHHDRGSGPA